MDLNPRIQHPWNVSLKEAREIQEQYRQLVSISPLPEELLKSATAVAAGNFEDRVFAVAVTTDHTGVPNIDFREGSAPLTFPYHREFLAFHQAPAILATLAQLNLVGNVIVVNGHGLTHPRRFGLASHLGVLLDYPTIGCAQTLLPGNKLQPSEMPLIDWVTDDDGIVGIAIYAKNPKTRKNPLILSIGHRTDVSTLIAFANRWMEDKHRPVMMRLARQLLRLQIRRLKE